MSFIDRLLDSVIAWSDRRKERAQRELVAESNRSSEQHGNAIAKNYAGLFNYKNHNSPMRCCPVFRVDDEILSATKPLPFDMAIPMSPGTCPISKSYNDAQSIRRSILDADYTGPVHFDAKRHAYIVSFATKSELLIFKLTYGGA